MLIRIRRVDDAMDCLQASDPAPHCHIGESEGTELGEEGTVHFELAGNVTRSSPECAPSISMKSGGK